MKQGRVNDKYSDSNKAKETEKINSEKEKITEQLEIEKQELSNTKAELESKIQPIYEQIKSLKREPFNGFDDDYYAREDKIEELEKSISSEEKSITTIGEVLDESFNHCALNDTKNNSYTAKYCSLKNQLSAKNTELKDLDDKFSDFKKDFASGDSIPFYMFGAFVIIVSCMIAFSIFMFTKRREMLAFGAQQIIPVGKEIIEDVAPTIGKASSTIAKEMAPAYGEIAKEVSKGIKDGLKKEKK